MVTNICNNNNNNNNNGGEGGERSLNRQCEGGEEGGGGNISREATDANLYAGVLALTRCSRTAREKIIKI